MIPSALFAATDALAVSPITQAVLTGIVVALINGLFQLWNSRHLKNLESRLAHRSGFYQRKLQALEELWPLIAQCSRDQSTIAYQKSEGTDLAPAATALGESRRKLKNYVYDKGLYMDEALRTKIRELDKRLADNTVIDVRTDVRDLEDFLREEARKLTGE